MQRVLSLGPACLALALALLFFTGGQVHAANDIGPDDIGMVMSYTPGASILRDGKTEALALRSGIRVSDTIQTDASGL